MNRADPSRHLCAVERLIDHLRRNLKVPCGTAPIAWGHSKDGDFVWRVGEPPVMMTEPPGPVIAVYPHALLCSSHEGDALLWCDLPPY